MPIFFEKLDRKKAHDAEIQKASSEYKISREEAVRICRADSNSTECMRAVSYLGIQAADLLSGYLESLEQSNDLSDQWLDSTENNLNSTRRNCTGGWKKKGDRSLHDRGGGIGVCERTYNQNWKCEISQPKLGLGYCECAKHGDTKTTYEKKGKRCSGNVGHWMSLRNEKGIAVDLLRSPHLEVSEDDLKSIVDKVNMGAKQLM